MLTKIKWFRSLTRFDDEWDSTVFCSDCHSSFIWTVLDEDLDAWQDKHYKCYVERMEKENEQT